MLYLIYRTYTPFSYHYHMSFPILISLTANLIFFKIHHLKTFSVLQTFSFSYLVGEKFYKHSQIHIFLIKNTIVYTRTWKYALKTKISFCFVPLFLNIFPIINLICQTTDFNINLTTQTCSSYHPTQGLHIVLSDSEVNCSQRFPAQLIRQHQYCSIKMHGSVYTEHTYSKCEDQAKINIPHALCRAFSWLIYQFL